MSYERSFENSQINPLWRSARFNAKHPGSWSSSSLNSLQRGRQVFTCHNFSRIVDSQLREPSRSIDFLKSQLKTEFSRFLNKRFIDLADACKNQLLDYEIDAESLAALKTVPADTFCAENYQDSDDNLAQHISFNRTEIIDFVTRARECGITLNVLSSDASMSIRLIAEMQKIGRAYVKRNLDLIKKLQTERREVDRENVDIVSKLREFSNFARRHEHRVISEQRAFLRMDIVFDEFLANKSQVGISCRKKYKKTFSVFTKLFGNDVLVTDFVSESESQEPIAVRFKKALMSTKSPIGRNEFLAPKTINGYLSNMYSLLDWCKKQRKIKFFENPFSELALPARGKSQSKRRKYKSDEIRRIISYLPQLKNEAESFRDTAYWLPKIMAFGLMRNTEVLLLRVSDIRTIHGVICFDMSEHNLKNRSSNRVVPVHQWLLDAGFMNFVYTCKSEGREYLFIDPALSSKDDEVMKIGNSISKWFNRTAMPNMGISKSDAALQGFSVNLYCLRNSGISFLKHLGAPSYVVKQLVGHSLARDITFGGYGEGTDTCIQEKRRVINLINYRSESWDNSPDDDMNDDEYV